eukprot:COSAG05_NODE_6228_length_995_cov_1.627232_1_plen_73_part_00
MIGLAVFHAMALLGLSAPAGSAVADCSDDDAAALTATSGAAASCTNAAGQGLCDADRGPEHVREACPAACGM